MTKVVTLETYKQARESISNGIVNLLGPALEKERQQNQARQNRIEFLSKNIVQLGRRNDTLQSEVNELKTKKGANESVDLGELKKTYAHILFSDVKDTLDEEFKKEVEKYLST